MPDPDPEIERRSFQVADGFEVSLFAADPLLAKPIQMNFDPAGRLWVACSEAYPQIKPGQRQNDKVIILEDTQGTGRADKTTVFADGLLIPTGLEPGDGGVYVVDSTDLLHLSASQPGGKADRRRVVLSGFGTEDTHHMVHTLRWGPDGMLYFNQSVYIHSHLETPHGVRRLGGGGIWQLRPETLELTVVLRGLVNPWGHHFDRWGQSFATDGAGSEGINYVVPDASYFWAVGATRILTGLNPGSPKHCGLEIVSGRHLPEAWQGNLITNDFRGHRVCRFVVQPDGSGYIAREQPEVIKTTHTAFRPIDVKMGPDGAIYVADWYNPIIQHGEVDFRDPRRDQTHGRIWRITAKNRPLVESPRLTTASVEKLLEAQKAPEDWTRHMARRVLKERGAPAVLPALTAWTAHLDAGKAEDELHLLSALWTYQSINVVEPKLLSTLLQAKDARIRAAAVRVAGAWHVRLADPLALLEPRIRDEHPQVRLEAVCALRHLPSKRAAETALVALDRPLDRFLDYALWQTCRELAPHWLPALKDGSLDFGGSANRLLFALQAVGTQEALQPVVDLVRSGKVPPAGKEGVATLIANLGGPNDLRLLVDQAMSSETTPAQCARLLTIASAGSRQRGVRPAGDLNGLVPLCTAGDQAVRAAAIAAAAVWKVETALPALTTAAKSAESSDDLRRVAIDGLATLGGAGSQAVLVQMSAEGKPEARRNALIALTNLDLKTAATRSADWLTHETNGDAVALFDAFLQRKTGADLLAAALANKQLPPDTAKLGLRAVKASGRPAPQLVEVLTQAAGAGNENRALEPAALQRMAREVSQLGDPARGERLFRRKDQLCLTCHAIAGAGGQVGPDLSSIGGSAQIDYLIESLLLPNKAVKEGYHATLVATKAGKLYTGIQVRQTAAELVLRTAEDTELVIPTKDVAEQAMGGSLMPEGLTDNLTRGEFLDLVRFLSELGKVGPYSASKARLARRWQVLEPTSAAGAAVGRGGLVGAITDPSLTWTPLYANVSGTIPVAELPRFGSISRTVIRCQIDVAVAGRLLLRVQDGAEVSAWLDQVPLGIKDETELNVAAGKHTLTLAFDPTPQRSLRVELEDVPGSPARANWVGGK